MKRFTLSLMFISTCLVSFSQGRIISGTVKSQDDGSTLPGVAVFVKGTTVGSVTNENGYYELSVSNNEAVLVFSFIGYLDEELPVGNSSVLDITLVPDITQLSEVVVIGYGTKSRRNVTGAISSVGSEEIKNVSVSTLERALQGRVSGAQITSTSGELGGGVTIRLRGPSSISASNQPLYVIDGTPIIQAPGGPAFGAGSSPEQSPLLTINPNDIESIEVLKDASSASIYGARASNGVVLITTKKGKAGKTKINLNYYAGYQEETNRFDLLTGEQFSQMWNDAGVNWFDKVQPGLRDALIGAGLGSNSEELWFNDNATALVFGLPTAIQQPDTLPNTDWLDLTHRRGFVQEFSADVSGGDDKTRFYVGATYRDEEGYLVTNELQRFSLRTNVSHQISDKVGLELLLNPTRVNSSRIAQGGAGVSPLLYTSIYYPNVAAFDSNGNFNTDFSPNAFGQFGGNPLQSVLDTDASSISTRVIGGLNLSYELVKNLVLRGEHSVDFLQREDLWQFPSTTVSGLPEGSSTALNSQILNWNLNYTLSYEKTVNDHVFDALLGASFQEVESNQFSLEAIKFATNDLLNISSSGEVNDGSGVGSSYAFNSYFGRIGYIYKDKYLFSANARFDGSSRFGEDNRYGFFPGVSAGWIVSEEPFMSGSNTLSFLKLRSSYGETGNANGISDFASLGLVSTGANYNNQPGILPVQIENPDLKWETTKQLDLGIEFGLFQNRITGTLGYFNKKTVDLLLSRPVPLTSGFGSFFENVGEMENQGFEVELEADVIKTNDFSWTLGFNIATLDNEVTKLIEGQDIVLGSRWLIREGEPLSSFYLVEYGGVDPDTGDALYFDLEGNRSTTFSNDNRKIMGNPMPDHFGGFFSQFTFKGFDLGVFFQYSYGNEVFRQEGLVISTNLGANFNQTADQFNYWTPENRDTDIPEPRLFTPNGTQTSSRYLEDASYLRLKTLSLGYTFPKSWVGDMDLRVYAQGQNLWTQTDFQGLDPEVSSTGADGVRQGDTFFTTPMPKTITFGFNIGL